MSKRTEHFDVLKARIETLGKAVFGDSLHYEVTSPVEDTHCDATLTLDHVVYVSVYEPAKDEQDAPVYYWGLVTHCPGNREAPPSDDFDQIGGATYTGLNPMLKEVFKHVFELRWANKLEAEADEAEVASYSEPS